MRHANCVSIRMRGATMAVKWLLVSGTEPEQEGTWKIRRGRRLLYHIYILYIRTLFLAPGPNICLAPNPQHCRRRFSVSRQVSRAIILLLFCSFIILFRSLFIFLAVYHIFKTLKFLFICLFFLNHNKIIISKNALYYYIYI